MTTELERIDREIERLKARRRELRRMPQDTFEPGAVISFTKRFSQDRFARSYRYAAIKTDDGLWYTTGPKQREPWLWINLMVWLRGDWDSLKFHNDFVFIQREE